MRERERDKYIMILNVQKRLKIFQIRLFFNFEIKYYHFQELLNLLLAYFLPIFQFVLSLKKSILISGFHINCTMKEGYVIIQTKCNKMKKDLGFLHKYLCIFFFRKKKLWQYFNGINSYSKNGMQH